MRKNLPSHTNLGIQSSLLLLQSCSLIFGGTVNRYCGSRCNEFTHSWTTNVHDATRCRQQPLFACFNFQWLSNLKVTSAIREGSIEKEAYMLASKIWNTHTHARTHARTHTDHFFKVVIIVRKHLTKDK